MKKINERSECRLKVFFDTSVLIAASGSESGASYYLLKHHKKLKIIPISSYYCLAELERNIDKIAGARNCWEKVLQDYIAFVVDTMNDKFPLPTLRAKDVPILAAAIAENCNDLLTLDQKDFGTLIGSQIHTLSILKPGDLLKRIS